ncbi:AAA family ATPase [Candidatus Igneacidithiobacillus taiwanensis]|uniref:ATP-dependent Clp protease ATP-binding subunit n=1 Tax=Candidatus Igneacidithiobacillus taiwanensis TaxID=1945924 RepID=UPI00289DE791|nr:AAA family ATPase [Candidatus Igneacidithiobacillus taiwanensis]
MNTVIAADIHLSMASTRIIGQDAAIHQIERAIRRVTSGLARRKNKPLASFLFTGPSGVGKTETAKAIAELVYGDIRRIVRFNANEVSGEGSQWRAFGPPPGYMGSDTGGQITQGVKRFGGRCVILIDEIEKGPQEIFDGLMACLDEGYLQDASFDERISTEDCIVVMTSNALVDDECAELTEEELRERVVNSKATDPRTGQKISRFRREFVGRIGNVVHFRSLSRETLTQILADTYLRETAVQIAINLQLLAPDMTPKALGFLVDQVGSGRFGVRGISKVLDEYILDRVLELPEREEINSKCWVWDFDEEEGKLILVPAFTTSHGGFLAMYRQYPQYSKEVVAQKVIQKYDWLFEKTKDEIRRRLALKKAVGGLHRLY